VSMQDLNEFGYQRNQCCCGLHVRTGALVIGIVGVLSSLIVLVLSAVYLWYIQLGLSALILVLYALVIVACEFKKPPLFVPFLVLNFAFVMFYGFYYIVSLFFLLIDLVSSLSVDYTTPEGMHGRRVDNSEMRWLTFAQMIGVLVSLVIGMWFETVVYRAYRSLKDECYSGPPLQQASNLLKPATFHRNVAPSAV